MQTRSRGRYRLDARIATGGMGEVWKATDTVLDREVALKLLKVEYADDPTFRARFTAEARNAAALHHSNVASVFDFGESFDGDESGLSRPFLVMELVRGEPLSRLLQGGQPMPPDTATGHVAQAADAIAAAHGLGILHRDVKPANLLVTPDGTVKITDFGIARAADGAVQHTQTGQIIGTPHYFAPEQAEGRPATEASDLYALGVVLYECLAGRRPFVADTPIQVALAHVRDEVPPLPPGVPEWVQAIVYRALAKNPEERFGSATEMADALRGRAVTGPVVADATVPAAAPVLPTPTQVMAAPTGPVPTEAPARRRARWPWLVVAALLVAVAATAVAMGGGEPSNTPSANPATGSDVEQTARPTQQKRQSKPAQETGIRVVEAQYLGQDAGYVKEALEDRGFEVREEKIPATSADQEKDTVAAIDPHGLVEPGTLLTMTVWEEYQPPKPSEGEGHPGKGKGKGEGQGNGQGEDGEEDDD
jgi:tRNA A-37 threonylcarbamoyl transferase component Bud32